MRVRCLLVSLLVCLVLSGLPDEWCAAETDSPTQLVQRLVQTIASIKAADNGTLSAEELAKNIAAAKLANTILDVPGVSQWTLGKHWNSRSPAEQQEFVTLLEALFAKVAFPKSAEFFNDLTVNIAGERVTDKQAVVRTTVTHKKEGLVSIDYRLIRHDDSWRVRDILLDDVSLAMNLRSQFNKIITEHSYAELLRRMRDKLAETSS